MYCNKCCENKSENKFGKVNGKCKSICRKCNSEYVIERNHAIGISKTYQGSPRHDLKGLVVGELTVVSNLGIKKNGKRYWKCICSCGKEKEISHNHLRHGKIKSCGCRQYLKGPDNPLWSGYGEISGSRWDTIKRQRRNVKKFSITIEYVWDLFISQKRKCKLSGLAIDIKDGTASLDRIDSKKGYIVGNVQWLHKDVNWMKNKFPQEYFINLCRHIALTSE